MSLKCWSLQSPKKDSFKFQEHSGELTQATTSSYYPEEVHYTLYYPGSCYAECNKEEQVKVYPQEVSSCIVRLKD